MQKIRKGDDVIIITGKDKGKRGSVLRTDGNDRLDLEMSIHISNVAIYNFSSKKSDRVGFKVDNNNKIRIFKSTGDLIKS